MEPFNTVKLFLFSVISESEAEKRLTFISSQAINCTVGGLVMSCAFVFPNRRASICCLKYENQLNTGIRVFLFLQQIGRGGDNSIMKGAECL